MALDYINDPDCVAYFDFEGATPFDNKKGGDYAGLNNLIPPIPAVAWELANDSRNGTKSLKVFDYNGAALPSMIFPGTFSVDFPCIPGSGAEFSFVAWVKAPTTNYWYDFLFGNYSYKYGEFAVGITAEGQPTGLGLTSYEADGTRDFQITQPGIDISAEQATEWVLLVYRAKDNGIRSLSVAIPNSAVLGHNIYTDTRTFADGVFDRTNNLCTYVLGNVQLKSERPLIHKAITAISSSFPKLITVPNHGVQHNDTLYFRDVVGTTELNDNFYFVSGVVNANQFYIQTSPNDVFSPYVSGGVITGYEFEHKLTEGSIDEFAIFKRYLSFDDIVEIIQGDDVPSGDPWGEVLAGSSSSASPSGATPSASSSEEDIPPSVFIEATPTPSVSPTEYEVLPYQSWYPHKHTLTRNFIEHEMGDGYSQTIAQDSPRFHADGSRSVRHHTGVHHFFLTFNQELDNTGVFGAAGGTERRANALWNFFRARLEADNEPFYYYNPEETLTIDPTGTSLVGRYLVRLAKPNEVLSREYFQAFVFKYGVIELVEAQDYVPQEGYSISVSVSSSLSPSASESPSVSPSIGIDFPPFWGAWTFQEASGTRYDVSGNGHHLLDVRGGAGLERVAGIISQYRLKQSTDTLGTLTNTELTCNAFPNLDNNREFTFWAWLEFQTTEDGIFFEFDGPLQIQFERKTTSGYVSIPYYLECGDLSLPWIYAPRTVFHAQHMLFMVVYRNIGGGVRYLDVMLNNAFNGNRSGDTNITGSTNGSFKLKLNKNICYVDEMAWVETALTEEQRTYVYNGGLGRSLFSDYF